MLVVKPKWKFTLKYSWWCSVWVASKSHWCAPGCRKAELSWLLFPSISKTSNKITTLLRLAEAGTTFKHWYALKPLLWEISLFNSNICFQKHTDLSFPQKVWRCLCVVRPIGLPWIFKITVLVADALFVLYMDILLNWLPYIGAIQTVQLKLLVSNSLGWYPHSCLKGISLSCISGI